MPDEMQRLQYVTANYHNLKGLRMTALVCAAITTHALALFGLLPPTVTAFMQSWGVAVVYIAAFAGGEYYYARRFGRLFTQPQQSDFADAGVALIIAVAMMIIIRFGGTASSVMSLVGGLIALFMLVCWWRGSRWRQHYVVLAVAALGLGALPILMGAGTTLITPSEQFIYGAGFATLFAIGGLLDHWLLVRTLRETRKGIHDAAV